MKIDQYKLIHVHDESPRYRKKCFVCENRKMCTQITLQSALAKRFHIIWLCYDCLTQTPNWT